MSEPLISVIVPVYNVEPYLDRCVESIVNQTYRNLEIILVDDGSPDRCPQMCEAWAERDARIRVIHKENGGLSDARNAGMAVASGELIGFVDSDDWILQDFFRILYDGLSKNDADISVCDILITDKDCVSYQSRTEFVYAIRNFEDAFADILRNKGIRAVAWNKLYRRWILENEAYPVGKYHEDEFLTYQLLDKAKRIIYVNCPLYCYYQRPESIMHSVTVKHLDVLDAHYERLAFLENKYPSLYLQDKLAYCTACVAFYRNTFRNVNHENIIIRKKLKNCRSRTKFKLSELRKVDIHQLIYIIASDISLHFFSWILYQLHKGKEA